jgi:hypothetical protein
MVTYGRRARRASISHNFARFLQISVAIHAVREDCGCCGWFGCAIDSVCVMHSFLEANCMYGDIMLSFHFGGLLERCRERVKRSMRASCMIICLKHEQIRLVYNRYFLVLKIVRVLKDNNGVKVRKTTVAQATLGARLFATKGTIPSTVLTITIHVQSLVRQH